MASAAAQWTPRDVISATMRSASSRLAQIGFSQKIGGDARARGSEITASGFGLAGKNGRGDVETLPREHLLVGRVGGRDPEPLGEPFEVYRIGVRDGDELRAAGLSM